MRTTLLLLGALALPISVLNPNTGGSPQPAVTIYEKNSGRMLRVFTDQLGLQFYTANFLDGSLTGKSGYPYLKRSALFLETQHFSIHV
jgi:aldose 1-epimerase